MSEKDPARFSDPDREEKPLPEDKNCYCVHCFEDKPESAMSIIDDCCQVCLAKAFDCLDRWDNLIDTIGKRADAGLSDGNAIIELSTIKVYIKGR